jgi:phosphoribosylformimino-5-aminoimidazole carboxamide ribonucleotide (ProFAR) isomerase
LPSAIEQIHREYKDRGLVIVAIDMEEGRDKVARWVKDKRMSITVLLDPTGRTTRAYEVTATPTVFIVGRDGKMVAKALGTKDWTGPRGRAFLEALLRP